MLRKTTSKTLILAAGVFAAGVTLAPLAAAEPCESTGGATVCQSNGSASMSAAPQVPAGGAGGSGDQNGSYGPNGNLPPVGR